MKKTVLLMILSLFFVAIFSLCTLAYANDGPETMPILSGMSVWRTAETTATIKTMPNKSGEIYYLNSSSVAVPLANDLSEWLGGIAATANVISTLTVEGLTAGKQYVYMVLKDEQDSISDIITIFIPTDYYYYEDFEAYPLGTYISSGTLAPISQVHNGTGNIDQKVSASVNNVSEKMLSLSSTGSWASDQIVNLDSSKLTSLDAYTFEGDVCPLLATSWQLRFSFTKGSYGGGNEAGIYFKNGNIVSISDGERVLKLGYEAERWYHIKVVIRPSTGKYAVYVDGQLLDDSLTLPSGINRLAITSGHGYTAYYDNLEFYTGSQKHYGKNGYGMEACPNSMLRIYNYELENLETKLYIAEYSSDNKLMGVTLNNVQIYADYHLDVALPIAKNDGNYLKAFLWGNNIRPNADSIRINSK